MQESLKAVIDGKHEVHNVDCVKFLREAFEQGKRWRMIFADPPDNIQLGYDHYKDKLSDEEYQTSMLKWLESAINACDHLWLSFNSRHTAMVGYLLHSNRTRVTVRHCVQTFTFGNHQRKHLTNNHRPLWLITKIGEEAVNEVLVPSWRLQNGDKRAKPGGKMVGDVFDFPRVPGNSRQRRKWHPTQLHEDLVERCVKLSTREGDQVLDMFGGTGTTLRVCRRLNRPCTHLEISEDYCNKLIEEQTLEHD